jgi:hypothetical protein
VPDRHPHGVFDQGHAGDADSFVTQLFPWPFAILRTNAVIGIAIE